MKKVIFSALLIALSYFTPAPSSAAASFSPALSSAVAPSSPAPSSASSTDTWLQGAAGYERAIQLHKERNLPLVVYFWADWCPYCQALDTRYLPSLPVQDYLRGVIKVRIAPEEGRAERMLAKQYNVKGYPAFFIVRDVSSKPVKIHPFSRSRSWTPEEFAEALQKAGPIPSDSAVRRNSQMPGSTKRGTSGGLIITIVPTAKTSPK